jgi:hypothetical protein
MCTASGEIIDLGVTAYQEITSGKEDDRPVARRPQVDEE